VTGANSTIMPHAAANNRLFYVFQLSFAHCANRFGQQVEISEGVAREAFSGMYSALKTGGILGVVEHRADPEKEQDPEAVSGYVRQDYVIELAESAGFEFIGLEEANELATGPAHLKQPSREEEQALLVSLHRGAWGDRDEIAGRDEGVATHQGRQGNVAVRVVHTGG